ncbi:unnamed protein product [Rhodiola kirilowii]
MEKKQEIEWAEAQKISISEDLVAAAKRQLAFLSAVDRSRWLYEGPALHKAIFRYNAYWLPLLAKHHEKQQTEGPLVVPLDCEWIWHCHRLNPIRYKMDCQKMYGRILDNSKVVSSTEGALKTETVDVWKRLFPEEPYELELTSVDISVKTSKAENFTDYDLVSAVQRQSPFYYQVSRSYVNTNTFLEEALARYKGFLHMIRSNRKRSIKRFCVPTYDIDLIWHTHQLHPISYCKDMMATLGKILEHDDMDADRSKGAKLDVGFSGTTKQWEDSFGTRYWKAGAMYRGSAPVPVTKTPYPFGSSAKKVVSVDEDHKILQLPERKYVEVILEIVDVSNLPVGLKGIPYVVFRKNQPDAFFSVKRKISISSLAEDKEVATFQCEPNGEIHFELVHNKHSHLPLSSQCKKLLGSASLSVSEFLSKGSALSVEKWFELVPSSASDSMKLNLKPVGLRIALSFTLPTSAPYVLQIAHPRSLIPNACVFHVPGRVKQSKSWTPVLDDAGTKIISLQVRYRHAHILR